LVALQGASQQREELTEPLTAILRMPLRRKQ
jgi:hypothetical protein